MNLSFWDYAIIVFFVATIIYSVAQSRQYVRSVADFLATNRSAGRYLLAISSGLCSVGAISILGFWEQNFSAGFSMQWWNFAMAIVVLVIAISGWVTYRYRQTRCLTMAQFFEQRYSRKFRIFSGCLAFVAGIVNYGIFPAIEAYFFIYFCGIEYTALNFALVIVAILGCSILFVLIGGQVAVVITDFLQGLFVSIAMVILVCCVMWTVGWEPIVTLLSTTPSDQSLVNPFKTSGIEIFNYWFFIINVLIVIYNKYSWQGTQGFNASAKNAHEAKMGDVLSTWRGIPYGMMFLVIPIACHAAFNCTTIPGFLTLSQTVSDQTTAISLLHSKSVANQLMTPLILVQLLPVGLKGLLVSVMIAAALSTHASYLHSWGSIFIQDVLIPFRNKPLNPKQHMLALRCSILGVSLFAFVFSMLYTPSEAIMPFMMITGAIFVGGSGAVIIGGLYWKKGSTLAAWSALLVGSITASIAILLPNLWGRSYVIIFREWAMMWHDSKPWLTFLSAEHFPINSAWMTLISMALAVGAYVLISLIENRSFNLDKLLHRGLYAIKEDMVISDEPIQKSPWWKRLGMGDDFSHADRMVVILTYIWNFGGMIFFLMITAWHFLSLAQNGMGISDRWWIDFWFVFIVVNLALGIVITIWFLFGGIKDLRFMFDRLSSLERDDSDDGFVRKDD